MEIDELYVKVAEHLAGCKVAIRWKQPVDSHAMGEVYQGETPGSAVIDVYPAASFETWWGIYLHEVAHCKLRHHLMTSKGAYKKSAGAVTRGTAEREAWSRSTPEKQASKLADQWEKYAEKHCYEYSYCSGIEARLKALLSWKEGKE